MTLVCLLFAGSAFVRHWQDWRDVEAKNRVIESPFSLKNLPKTIGTWHMMDGKEATLDPEIARVAGSIDSTLRVYVDDETGVAITVLLLFGRAEAITGHTPDVCYPAAGYEYGDGDVIDVPIRMNPNPAIFRASIFAKRAGATVDREEVFYSFRNEGRWSPSIAGNWRALRYNPGIFKLQIQRRVAESEHRHLNNPSQIFLDNFLPELERMINTTAKPTEKKASAPSSNAK